jgi:hypothetical protein
MPSVARVTYIPLRALAVNVIAICSRSRRKKAQARSHDFRRTAHRSFLQP